MSFHVYTTGDAGPRILRVVVPEGLRDFSLPENVRAGRGTTPASSHQPTFIAIIDRSGSMGQWVGRIMNQVLPDTAAGLGYTRNDELHVVTFDSDSEHLRETIPQLRRGHFNSRGATYMAPAVRELVAILQRTPGPVRILTVSDGLLHDMDQVIAMSHVLRSTAANHDAPIAVSMHRLHTGLHACPDTRGMATIGALATVPAQIHDHRVGTALRDISTAAIQDLQAVSGHSCTLSANVAMFQRSPGGPVSSTVQLSTNTSHFLLVPPEVDLSQVQISLAGEPGELSQEVLQDEQSVSQLLNFLDSRIRAYMVVMAGGRGGENDNAAKQELEAMFNFIDSVGTFLKTQSALAAEAAMSTTGSEQDMRNKFAIQKRAQALAKASRKARGSLLQRISQLRNSEAMHGINDAQSQADFLRGIDGSKTGRALARRSAKHETKDTETKDVSSTTRIVQELVHFTNAAERDAGWRPSDSDIDALPISFYSTCNLVDYIEALIAIKDDIPEMNATELLQLISLIGVPFRGPVGNFPDPWQFQVYEVYTNCFLSAADLWSSIVQSSASRAAEGGNAPPASSSYVSELRFTGVDGVITGVDGLRSPSPSLFRFIHQHIPFLNQVHTSISMRRAMVPMPYDSLALKTAVTWTLLCQCVDAVPRPTERACRVLLYELKDLRHALSTWAKDCFKDLVHALCNSTGSVVAIFTAENYNVTSELKPILLFLAHPGILSAIGAELFATYLRLLFKQIVYYQVRRIVRKQRAKAEQEENPPAAASLTLERFLGTEDLSRHATPVNRDGIAVSPDFQHYSTPEIRDPDDLQDLRLPVRLRHVACIKSVREVLDSGETIWSEAPFTRAREQEEALLGLRCSEQEYVRYSIFQALKYPEEKSRFDKSADRCLMPDATESGQISSELSAEVESMYRRDYEKRLAQRLSEMEEERQGNLVDTVVATYNMKEFEAALRDLKTRNCAAFRRLEQYFFDSASSDAFPMYFCKLLRMLTGRDEFGNEIWTGGNVYTERLLDYRELYIRHKATEEWAIVKDILKKYNRHTYRPNLLNRHGYGNDHPSWWALGFGSKEAFLASMTPHERSQWLQQHTDRKKSGKRTSVSAASKNRN